MVVMELNTNIIKRVTFGGIIFTMGGMATNHRELQVVLAANVNVQKILLIARKFQKLCKYFYL